MTLLLAFWGGVKSAFDTFANCVVVLMTSLVVTLIAGLFLVAALWPLWLALAAIKYLWGEG